MKIRSFLARISGVSLALVTCGAHADITSTYTAGSDGWSVVSFGDLSQNSYSVLGVYTPTFSPVGGNPGGFISSIDPDGGDFTFGAPSAYLGNVSAATGMSYDLIRTSGVVNYQSTNIMLVGAGTRLLWRANPDVAPTATWQTVTVQFAPSANWLVGTTAGASATAADFQAVLGNLTGLFIKGEYAFGAEDTGIDNVRLIGVSAIPEPSTNALLLAGIACVFGGISRTLRLRRPSEA